MLLIPASILVNLLAAPYTKVEESFNIQATHDILTYVVPYPWENTASLQLRNHYDHLTFTGPIPRTFVGPLALAGASWPFLQIFHGSEWQLGRQMIVRAVLGLYNAFCLLAFRASVARCLGWNVANWYAVFQASQFHIMFYASRTLPNFFAFGLTTLAMRNLLPLPGRSPTSGICKSRYATALALLTVSGIVFRSEIALLLACHTLYLLFAPHIRLPFTSILLPGVLGVIIGLVLTLPIDTFFWQTYPNILWPELSGFLYNVYHNKAQDWGVQVWHFYFTSALPRLLFNPLLWQICLPFTLFIPNMRRPALDVLVPNLLFVVVYSFQPHKEWRFIIYVVPPLLAVASAGASWIWTRRAKSFAYRVMSLALVASTLAAFLANLGMLFVSRLNYPGGEAIGRLHELAQHETGVVRVHMDTLSCMTGVTRFLEKRPPVLADGSGEHGKALWVYDKTEDRTALLDPLFWEGVEFVLTEDPRRIPGQWEALETVSAFVGIGLLRPDEARKGQDLSFDDIKILADFERKRWTRKARDVWVHGWTGEEFDGVQESLASISSLVEEAMRKYITGGWWVRVNMEPRIHILKREKESMLEAFDGARDLDEELRSAAQDEAPLDPDQTSGSASVIGQKHKEL